MARAKGSKNCSDTVFVQTYIRTDLTVQGVADTLGMTYNNVINKAGKLRKKGVVLPEKPRAAGVREKDVAGLNALIANATKTETETAETEAETTLTEVEAGTPTAENEGGEVVATEQLVTV